MNMNKSNLVENYFSNFFPDLWTVFKYKVIYMVRNPISLKNRNKRNIPKFFYAFSRINSTWLSLILKFNKQKYESDSVYELFGFNDNFLNR